MWNKHIINRMTNDRLTNMVRNDKPNKKQTTKTIERQLAANISRYKNTRKMGKENQESG